MKSNSWIIVKKGTLEAILETWNKSSLKYLKPEYEALTTYNYLTKINKVILKNGGVLT